MLKTQPVLIFEYTTQTLVFNRGLLLNKGACRTYSPQAQPLLTSYPSRWQPACEIPTRPIGRRDDETKLYDDERTIRRKERPAEDRREKN